jgi:uncharacterized membrane protein YdjX (TVP38/TMEM64 family)
VDEYFLLLMPENKFLVAFISIVANVIISISGILPSAFLTAANIAFFDLKIGLIISIIGEASGAIVSFIIYRKSLIKLSNQRKWKNKLLIRLQHSKGLEASLIVFLLRTLPFIPSGVVTLFAAYSLMGLVSFSIASTLGKIPSLLIEAYAVSLALQISTKWQLISFVFILIFMLIYLSWKKKLT